MATATNPRPLGAKPTSYTFKVVVEPDEDRWHAYAPGLEQLGAATWGYSREEALTHIREVLEMVVAESSRKASRFPSRSPPRSRSSPSPYERARLDAAAQPERPRDHQRSGPRRLREDQAG